MPRPIKRVGLINTGRQIWSRTPRIKTALDDLHRYLKPYCTPNLSLLTIGSLTPSDIEVQYIDEDSQEIDWDGGYDVVGISAITQEAPRAYAIADEFRRRGVHVAFGGIHASVVPEEALEHADTVFVGEAEKTWGQFLRDFGRGDPGRVYTQPLESLLDLEISPVPRYSLLTTQSVFRDPSRFINMIPVQVSRGCPHDCDFCLVSKIQGTRCRTKKLEQVEAEIREIKKHFPNRVILFADDNLFVNRRFSLELLELLKGLKIRYWAQCDIRVGSDPELVRLAYESGALIFLIGMESLNPENLRDMNKSQWKFRQAARYGECVDAIQEQGIIVFGSFMFGLDHDTPDVFPTVARFMDDHKITGQFTIATPLPGTDLFRRLQQEGRLLPEHRDWERYTFLDVLFKPRHMTRQQLEDGFIAVYREVFSQKASETRAKHLKGLYRRLADDDRGGPPAVEAAPDGRAVTTRP